MYASSKLLSVAVVPVQSVSSIRYWPNAQPRVPPATPTAPFGARNLRTAVFSGPTSALQEDAWPTATFPATIEQEKSTGCPAPTLPHAATTRLRMCTFLAQRASPACWSLLATYTRGGSCCGSHVRSPPKTVTVGEVVAEVDVVADVVAVVVVVADVVGVVLVVAVVVGVLVGVSWGVVVGVEV